MTPEARFERIETNLQVVTEKMAVFATGMTELRTAHMELETAQLNQTKTHEKLARIVGDLGEKVANLTILVNQLIERDLRG